MNHNDPKQRKPDPLENAMKAMRSVETSVVPRQVVERTRVAMTRSSRRRRWRTRVLQGAAAAIVAVVLIGVFGVITNTSSSLALADVVQQVAATKTLRSVIVDSNEGGALFISGSRIRYEGPGAVTIADLATGQEVMLDTRNMSAYRTSPAGNDRTPDLYGMIRDLTADASSPIEEYVDEDGRHFPGFSGGSELKFGGETVCKVDAKVWIDAKTKLPVRLEIRVAESGEKVALFEQIEFDVPLDDALFDMSVPKGYTVVTLGSAAELKPPPNEQ